MLRILTWLGISWICYTASADAAQAADEEERSCAATSENLETLVAPRGHFAGAVRMLGPQPPGGPPTNHLTAAVRNGLQSIYPIPPTSRYDWTKVLNHLILKANKTYHALEAIKARESALELSEQEISQLIESKPGLSSGADAFWRGLYTVLNGLDGDMLLTENLADQGIGGWRLDYISSPTSAFCQGEQNDHELKIKKYGLVWLRHEVGIQQGVQTFIATIQLIVPIVRETVVVRGSTDEPYVGSARYELDLENMNARHDIELELAE